MNGDIPSCAGRRRKLFDRGDRLLKLGDDGGHALTR